MNGSHPPLLPSSSMNWSSSTKKIKICLISTIGTSCLWLTQTATNIHLPLTECGGKTVLAIMTSASPYPCAKVLTSIEISDIIGETFLSSVRSDMGVIHGMDARKLTLDLGLSPSRSPAILPILCHPYSKT